MSGADPSSTRRRPFPPLPAWVGPTTRLVHGGRRPDLNAGAVVPPIYQTATFHYPGAYSESAEGGDVYLYSRIRNPTVEGPEEVVRELEHGESARLFASGMGAITSTLLSLVRPGDEIVATTGLYGGTTDLLHGLLAPYGVRVREVTDEEARSPATCLSTETRLAILETPTNPTLRVHDIAEWARATDAAGALLLVDNTFASPINQNPLSLGADLVVHSATKYLGGHSDLIAGAVIGPERLLRRIDPKHYLGAPLDPFAAFLLHRSLKTLSLRVARHNRNAETLAVALRGHRAVRTVYYPGWATADDETIARRQMRGRGGMVSFSLRDGAEAVGRFLARLRIIHVASSLGGVESLASVPSVTSHRHLSRDELAARGIDDGLVRLSLGIEEPEDLVRDVTEALGLPDGSAPPAL